jgi:hypothetical protein
MENKNYTILFRVFMCKTKYLVYIIIYVTVLRGDNTGRYGDKRKWQV